MIIEKFELEINDLDGVRAFFKWLHEVAMVAFDPVDTFLNYVNMEDGTQSFCEEDIERYDLLMDKCQEICDRIALDIHAVANEVTFPWMKENEQQDETT